MLIVMFEGLIKHMNAYMNFSSCHPSHPDYVKANKNVPGNLMDELNGEITTSFPGVKPKSHCCKIHCEMLHLYNSII